MPWSPFQSSVKNKLEAEGWVVVDDGFPDLICFKDGEVKFVECKTHQDRMWSNQEKTIELLRAAGLDVEVVKESLPEMRTRLARRK